MLRHGAAATTIARPRAQRGTLRLDRTAPRLVPRATTRTGPAPLTWAGVQKHAQVALMILDVVAAALFGLIGAVLAGPTGAPWVLGVAAGTPILAGLLGGTSAAGVRRGTYGRAAVIRSAAVVGLACLGAAQVLGIVPPLAVTTVTLPGAAVVMYLGRFGVDRWVRRARATGRARPRTVLLGADQDVAALVGGGGLGDCEVVGRCAATPGQPVGPAVLGTEEDVAALVQEHRIDVVMVAGTLEPVRLRRLSNELATTGTALVLAPNVVDVDVARVQPLPMGTGWELRLLLESRRRTVRGKALLDRVLGALLLLAVSPVLAVCALAVRLTSPGPVFFGQTRMGRDGLPFRMWKLRSMVVDAEARQAQLIGDNEAAGVLFKMRRDPRVTPVGAVLRRYSLDELPQLWNVVCGQMSLVGPRPPLPAEVARYRGEEPRRLMVKPGLTGLWQVSGRSDLSWEDSVRLDLRYVDNWSLALDLRILAGTARAVLGAHGAY